MNMMRCVEHGHQIVALANLYRERAPPLLPILHESSRRWATALCNIFLGLCPVQAFVPPSQTDTLLGVCTLGCSCPGGWRRARQLHVSDGRARGNRGDQRMHGPAVIPATRQVRLPHLPLSPSTSTSHLPFPSSLLPFPSSLLPPPSRLLPSPPVSPAFLSFLCPPSFLLPRPTHTAPDTHTTPDAHTAPAARAPLSAPSSSTAAPKGTRSRSSMLSSPASSATCPTSPPSPAGQYSPTTSARESSRSACASD